MPPDVLAATLERLTFEIRTDRTITTPERLEEELRVVARRGWATDIGENSEGVNCVGAPIYGRDAFPVAAISASAPAHRFTRGNINHYGQMVVQPAQTISRGLGPVGASVG